MVQNGDVTFYSFAMHCEGRLIQCKPWSGLFEIALA